MKTTATAPAPPTAELFARYVMPTYGRFPLRLARGQGCRVWDEDGKPYLDFGAGVAVCSAGHCHPRVVAAVQAQLGSLVHTSNLYFTRPQGLLAKKLVEIVGTPGKVFFCNSGAEANEALLKMARRFGHDGIPARPAAAAHRFEVITCHGSFHGRTFGGISATGQDKVKLGFEPLLPGFVHVTFGDLAAVAAAITERTVAVMVEPIQGESGIHPAPAAFLRGLRRLCDENDLLLLFDEVQCGLGRTGDWCAWKTIAGDDLVPDGVSWAKGVAGGFPLGAAWVRDREVQLKSGHPASLADILGPGLHGSTFGGTPLVCTGALEVLAIIGEEGLLANARRMGERARAALAALAAPGAALIREVRGVGLMIGIELVADFAERVPCGNRPPSLHVIDHLHANGLLAVPAGTHCVRWLPPLIAGPADVDEAVDILGRTLDSLAAN